MWTPRAWGDAQVLVRWTGFSPSSVSINVGEWVSFVVADDNGPYCIQSTIGAWTPWYLFDYGDGFRIQFNERGDYYYRDTFTYNTGVIHVGTPSTNFPPAVTITSPHDGDVFTEPASFEFSATVTDADNGVMAVDFYIDGVLLERQFTPPFSTLVTNVPAGPHQLTVTAYDNAWAMGTASIGITVTEWVPPEIRLGSAVLTDGQFQFQATGATVGKQLVLECATGLNGSAQWMPLQTNSVDSATVFFSTQAVPGAQFFRVVQLP